MQSTKLKEYKIRPGTNDQGRDYEINILALLSLRCLQQSEDDFWLASNADDVGAFDDIVLRKGEDTFMLQLKHKEKLQNTIKEHNFLCKKTIKKNDFSLEKYDQDIGDLKDKLDACSTSSDTKSIVSHLGSFDKIKFLIYTNRDTERCGFLNCLGDGGELCFLNSRTGTDVFNIKTQHLPSTLCLNNIVYVNSKFLLFPNQSNAEDVRIQIEEEIRSITKSGSSGVLAKLFLDFITEWSKGHLGGYYCLTRQHIVSKLTELLLSDYEVNVLQEPFTSYERKKRFIWNEILEDKKITIIDINSDMNKLIFDFLLQYIGSEIRKRCKITEKKNWCDNLAIEEENAIYKDNLTLRAHVEKIIGNHDDIRVYDVYRYLWSLQKVPLILQVSKIEQYEHILQVLKKFNYFPKIVILNKSNNVLTLRNKEGYHFESLEDLNNEQREEILNKEIKFQGRPGAKLKDLIDETMFSFIKASDIINILLNNYNIGKELTFVPKYYVPRKLGSPIISYGALSDIKDEIFVIEDVTKEHFKEYAINENLKTNYLKYCNLENLNDCNIFIVDKLQEIKDLQWDNRNVHYLKTIKTSTTVETYPHYLALAWQKSFGNIRSIKKYQTPCFADLEDFLFKNLTTVISADPGMGKSMLMDHIAQLSPVHKWVLKINLRSHNSYFEDLKQSDKTKQSTSLNYLNYFKDTANSKLEENVFKKLLTSRNIIVLMDGFDEISISYKDVVATIAKSFYDDNISLYITTRPMMAFHLEEQFNVFALELLPFDANDQKLFLKGYLCGKEKLSSEKLLTKFVENLLGIFKKATFSGFHTVGKIREFTSIPLHLQLLAVVSYEDYENIEFDKNLDLLDLYRKFIYKKNKIICEKYSLTASYDLLKDYQPLLAVKILFQNCNNVIDEFLTDIMGQSGSKCIQVLQQGGILTIDERCNVNFVHQTFAEYLTAEWLAENFDNKDTKIQYIIKEVFTQYIPSSNKITYTTIYPFLFNIFNCFMIRKSLNDDLNPLSKVIYTNIINGQLDKITEKILSNPPCLACTDKAGRSLLHLIVIYSKTYPSSLQDVFLLTVKKTLKIREDVFGYNPLDYAIANDLLWEANTLCKKWQNLKINLTGVELSQLPAKDILQAVSPEPYLWKAFLAYFIYRDIFKNRVKECETVGTYLTRNNCFSIEEKIKIVVISQLPSLDLYKKSDLCYQIVFGDNESVQQMLSTSTEINTVDVGGDAPLHYAISYQKSEMIDLLLSAGADVNVRNEIGQTPLHYSTKWANINIFRELLCRADVTVQDINGDTPLHWAVQNKQLKMIELLLQNGANKSLRNRDGRSPINTAVFGLSFNIKTRSNILNYPLQNGGKTFSYPQELPKLEDYIKMYSEIIKQLLSNGDDINIKDDIGETALFFAIRCDNYEIVENLISLYKPEVNVQNEAGNTPLHFATRQGNLEILRLLLSNNAETNIQNNRCETPLHWAAYSNTSILLSNNEISAHGFLPPNLQLKMIDLFLEYRVNVNVRNNAGETPLFDLVRNNKFEIAEKLILSNSDVNLQNNFGISPLHLAAGQFNPKDSKILNLLLLKGASIKIKNSLGETPLHYSAYYGNRDFTETLILREADVNLQNYRGEAPLHYAMYSKKNPKVLNLLISNGADRNIITTFKEESVSDHVGKLCPMIIHENVQITLSTTLGRDQFTVQMPPMHLKIRT